MADENWSTQLRKGVLELCILNLLQRESLHGYAIVKRLTEYPGLVISEGTVVSETGAEQQGFDTRGAVEGEQ